MATHSSILAGKKIPQREEPGKATVSIGSQSQTRLTELVPVHAHVHTHTHTQEIHVGGNWDLLRGYFVSFGLTFTIPSESIHRIEPADLDRESLNSSKSNFPFTWVCKPRWHHFKKLYQLNTRSNC